MDGPVRLPDAEHTSRPWRIHELTPDFRLEDVWALPTPGGSEDFPRLVSMFASQSFPNGLPLAARTLWVVRQRLGGWLGWDDPGTGLGSRVRALRERLPGDLRDSSGPASKAGPFTILYQLDDEWAAEVANRTVHGVIHLGWVRDTGSGYTGQMAVLVKPNGLLGSAYLAAIRPFRHLVVYPAVMRRLALSWQDRRGAA